MQFFLAVQRGRHLQGLSRRSGWMLDGGQCKNMGSPMGSLSRRDSQGVCPSLGSTRSWAAAAEAQQCFELPCVGEQEGNTTVKLSLGRMQSSVECNIGLC